MSGADRQDRLKDGQAFGRYQIVRLIGEGGMGAVYEAVHLGLKKRFAIKALLPSVAQSEEARLRFLREGEAAATINHPNVVAVTDVGTEAGVPYLVMEYLEGQVLGDLLAVQRVLGIEEAVGLLLPVVAAAATGHDAGVIHRDLKPQNIFLCRGRFGEVTPKVLDFGVSKFTREDRSAAITQTMSVLGTAPYMSPEQARGAKRVEFASDQYALGLILYEMLTGQRAHAGEHPLEILHNVASMTIRPARELLPDLPAALDAVLGRMLAGQPADRFRSLHECGRALLPFADPRTRAAMANAFRPEPVTGETSPVSTSAIASAPASAVSSPVAPSPKTDPLSGPRRAGSLSAQSTPSLPLDTTLRHATGEARPVSAGVAPAPPPPKPKRTFGVVVAVVAVVGAVVAGKLLLRTPSPQRAPAVAAPPVAPAPGDSPANAMQPSTPFEIRAVPDDAQIALDDRAPASGRLELVLPLAGPSHVLRVSAPGYVSKVVEFHGNDPPPAEIQLERLLRPEAPPSAAKPRTRVPAPSGAGKPAIGKPTPSPAPASVARPKKPNCDPNFFLDAQGEKHFKPECFLDATHTP